MNSGNSTPQTRGLESNQDWLRWGETDPLWAVATEKNRQANGTSPWTDEAFFAAGQEDWREFSRVWMQYGLDPSHCLEIGCGAGRITRALSGTFDSVLAVDVSPNMLSHARAALSLDAHVHFDLVQGLQLPLPIRPITAVFSTHVFQHLDSPDLILQYFDEAYRVMAPEATLMIHVPMIIWPAGERMTTILRLMHEGLRTLSTLQARLRRRAGFRLMRMTSVSIEVLLQRLLELGFCDVDIRVITAPHNQHPHPFVLARKPGVKPECAS